MKDFLFISDFDGTITYKDFYKMIIDDFMPEEGARLRKLWREEKLTDKQFLSTIFQSINLDERGIDEVIKKIPLDPGVIPLINKIRKAGGDFIILSAGTNYYINKLLGFNEINGIPVYSNEGIYSDKGIKVTVSETSPYYSEKFGIDKAKVVEKYRPLYKTIYFAGDSTPDIDPAKLSDVVFAKSKLKRFLSELNVDYLPFENFNEIQNYMEKEGII